MIPEMSAESLLLFVRRRGQQAGEFSRVRPLDLFDECTLSEHEWLQNGPGMRRRRIHLALSMFTILPSFD